MDKSNRYMMRGVSAAKEDVHNAIKNIDKGLYPQAFCKIIPDILGGDPEIATSCMLTVQVRNRHLPICTGRKLAISAYGRALLRTLS